MSAWEVLERFGTAKLLGFLLALLVFVVLHLARLPLLLLARLLEAAMSRVDAMVTTAVSVSTTRVYAGPAGAGVGGEDLR